MSVSNPGDTRLVFCEGETKGPDERLIARLILPFPARYRLQVQVAGGKQAIRNFARGYALSSRNANWIALTDRDLDMQPDNGQLLTWDKDKSEQRVFLTGLTCIESYFLDATLLHGYLIENRPNSKISIPSSLQIEQALQQTIAELADYQAVRWALQALRQQLQSSANARKIMRTAGVFDLPNRLTSDDGKLPSSLDLMDCQVTAHQFITDFVEVAQEATVGKFDEYLREFQHQFTQDSFRIADYKLWFHGKDVLKRWLQHPLLEPHEVGSPRYMEWAVQHLDLTQFPDLQEFARRCWA